MKRRFLSVLLTAATVLSMTACGVTAPETTTTTTTATETKTEAPAAEIRDHPISPPWTQGTSVSSTGREEARFKKPAAYGRYLLMHLIIWSPLVAQQ